VMFVAEDILDGRVQCTLGGEYQRAESDLATWFSTAWGEKTPPIEPPTGYQAPVLRWLHGLDARLTQLDDRLVVDLTLDVQ
ncbi:MAG: hypothetical protein ACPHL6_12780, partial [Rubripirellula sp.]